MEIIFLIYGVPLYIMVRLILALIQEWLDD